MTDRIREFFRRKKNDQKFKQAGPGHKLSDPKPEAKRSSQPASVSRSNDPSRSTDGARRAAEAALARNEASKQQKRVPNWSLEAIRAQARKEMELEAAQAEKQQSSSVPKVVSQESASILAVSGVYFNCPLVGPDVLPKKEMQHKIKEFLYSQLEHEPGLTACLILRTCNYNKEKVNQGVNTICTYLKNIVENPEEEKYRKIRLQNKAFMDRVSSLEGALDLLYAAGFQNSSDGEFLVFNQENLDVENLDMLTEALRTAEPIVPQLDRNTRVLLPLEAHAEIRLPDDFFNLTTEELRREQEKRTEEVELNSILRTKAMRDKALQKEMRMYRYTLIRIKFPDEIILQGTFGVNEKLSSVYEFIGENLVDSGRCFHLLAPGGFKLDTDSLDNSLLELKLIPAAKLHLSWSGTTEDFSKSSKEAFLKPETMALLQSL